jgi:hypothetical protein
MHSEVSLTLAASTAWIRHVVKVVEDRVLTAQRTADR